MKDQNVRDHKGIISAPRQQVTVEKMNEAILNQTMSTTLLAAGEWLTADLIHALQQPPSTDPSQPATGWKRQGRTFGVPFGGSEYFARYQFDAVYQPLPIIESILTALGPIDDPWKIAAWSHFPNGWIAEGARPIASKDALGKYNDVLEAARKVRGSHVA